MQRKTKLHSGRNSSQLEQVWFPGNDGIGLSVESFPDRNIPRCTNLRYSFSKGRNLRFRKLVEFWSRGLEWFQLLRDGKKSCKVAVLALGYLFYFEDRHRTCWCQLHQTIFFMHGRTVINRWMSSLEQFDWRQKGFLINLPLNRENMFLIIPWCRTPIDTM